MIYYLKKIPFFLVYMIAGAIAAVAVGYLCGAIGGLLSALYNNLFFDNVKMNYLATADLCGRIITIFAVLPGVGVGFFIGLVKEVTKNDFKN